MAVAAARWYYWYYSCCCEIVIGSPYYGQTDNTFDYANLSKSSNTMGSQSTHRHTEDMISRCQFQPRRPWAAQPRNQWAAQPRKPWTAQPRRPCAAQPRRPRAAQPRRPRTAQKIQLVLKNMQELTYAFLQILDKCYVEFISTPEYGKWHFT